MATARGFEAAAAYVGCDGTVASARAIASKYNTKAAVHLYALYNQAMEGRCQLLKPQGSSSDFEIHLFNRWRAFRNLKPIIAKDMFIRILEIVDPRWIVMARDSVVEPITEADMHIHVPSYIDAAADVQREAKLKALQDDWLRFNWDPELEILDSASERAIEDSRKEEMTDLIQLVICKNRERVKQAKQKYIELGENDTLEPKHSREDSSTALERIERIERILKAGGLFLIRTFDCWITPTVYGESPKPRYQHGASMLDIEYKMFVSGGSDHNVCYNDVQVLDLMSFEWSNIEAGPEKALPSALGTCSGRAMFTWKDRIFSIVEHAIDPPDFITVNEFDVQYCTWTNIKTDGRSPISHGGQSVTLVGDELVIFGGEDASKSALNVLHILKLETMTWVEVDAIGDPPPPRSNHAAACHNDQYLFIFGGQWHTSFYNDLHMLDLRRREWSRPQIHGAIPGPRAGHVGAAIEDNWFIVGGGDDQNRYLDTIMLNMSTCVWSVVTRTSPTSEGMSLVASSYDGEDFLISFGGYNEAYNNEVRVIRLSYKWDEISDRYVTPVLNTTSLQLPATDTSTSDRRQSDAWIPDWNNSDSEHSGSKSEEELEATPHRMETRKRRKLRTISEMEITEETDGCEKV